MNDVAIYGLILGVTRITISNIPAEGNPSTDGSQYRRSVPQIVEVKDLLKGQGDDESFTKLPKLPYTGAIVDCEYALDSKKKWHPAPLLAGQFKKFLEDFNSLTSCKDWVVACFCGFAQLEAFYNVAKEVCSGQVEKMFWVKSVDTPSLRQMSENASVAPENYANRIENFLLCYYTSKPVEDGKFH